MCVELVKIDPSRLENIYSFCSHVNLNTREFFVNANLVPPPTPPVLTDYTRNFHACYQRTCIYRVAWNISEGLLFLRDLVRICFAAVVIDATLLSQR